MNQTQNAHKPQKPQIPQIPQKPKNAHKPHKPHEPQKPQNAQKHQKALLENEPNGCRNNEVPQTVTSSGGQKKTVCVPSATASMFEVPAPATYPAVLCPHPGVMSENYTCDGTIIRPKMCLYDHGTGPPDMDMYPTLRANCETQGLTPFWRQCEPDDCSCLYNADTLMTNGRFGCVDNDYQHDLTVQNTTTVVAQLDSDPEIDSVSITNYRSTQSDDHGETEEEVHWWVQNGGLIPIFIFIYVVVLIYGTIYFITDFGVGNMKVKWTFYILGFIFPPFMLLIPGLKPALYNTAYFD